MNRRTKYKLNPQYSLAQISNCIDDWIGNSTYRDILKRIYLDGISNQEAAEEYGYCTNNIKNIVKECYPVLKEHLDNV